MYICAASSVAKSVLLHRQHLPIFLSVKLVFTRQASASSKHPFPFPPCTNPTPHEIFHLPRSASQGEIKSRYYELVKVYHPDAIRSQHDVAPSVRNARFRAITHAYGVLRGRRSTSSHGGVGAWDYYESRDEAMRAELRRRSRRSGSASSSTTTADDSVRHENIDNDQLRYTFMALAVAAVIVAMGSVSTHLDNVERHSRSAAANLVQARADAQVDGMERRRNIRERVRAMREAEAKEMVDGTTAPEMHDTSKVWQGEPPPGETGTENVSNDERM